MLEKNLSWWTVGFLVKAIWCGDSMHVFSEADNHQTMVRLVSGHASMHSAIIRYYVQGQRFVMTRSNINQCPCKCFPDWGFLAAFPCCVRLLPAVGRWKWSIGTTRLTPVVLFCLVIHFIHSSKWKWNEWCFRPRFCTCKAILGRCNLG